MSNAPIRVYDCARAMVKVAHLDPWSRSIRLASFGFTIDEVKAAARLILANSQKGKA